MNIPAQFRSPNRTVRAPQRPRRATGGWGRQSSCLPCRPGLVSGETGHFVDTLTRFLSSDRFQGCHNRADSLLSFNQDGYGIGVGRLPEVASKKGFKKPATLHLIETVADWPVNAPTDMWAA